ncbi:MAG: hypothetical protein IH612_01780 [Desulfofustis sp.]|nr:hypothetical protein [Desulfofustis sp.]
MANYRDIDEMLLTTNKGSIGSGPGPGDGVVVSIVCRGVHELLLHYVNPGMKLCRGETRDKVFDGDGNELLGKAEYVQFSTKKIAGINRR